MSYRLLRKNCVFFPIHCNLSLAYIAVRDLQSSQSNASVQSLRFVQPIAAEYWRMRGGKLSRIFEKNTVFNEHPVVYIIALQRAPKPTLSGSKNVRRIFGSRRQEFLFDVNVFLSISINGIFSPQLDLSSLIFIYWFSYVFKLPPSDGISKPESCYGWFLFTFDELND